jgi:hypothetical protein
MKLEHPTFTTVVKRNNKYLTSRWVCLVYKNNSLWTWYFTTTKLGLEANQTQAQLIATATNLLRKELRTKLKEYFNA